MVLSTQEQYQNFRSTVLISAGNLSNLSFDSSSSKEYIENNNYYKGTENGLYINKLSILFLYTEVSLSSLILVNFILDIVYCEQKISKAKEQEKLIILWAIAANVFAQTICTYTRYTTRLNLTKSRKQSTEFKNLFLSLQILGIIISPYPFLQGYYIGQFYYEEIEVNSLMILLFLPKLIILVRGLINLFSMYSQPRCYRACRFYNFSNNYIFQFRCIFKDHPFALTISLYFIAVLYLGYGVRIAEINNTSSPFQHYGNCIWMALLTMTTIGYGQLVPQHTISKLICGISAYFGVFTLSMLILWLTNYLTMNHRQERSLTILNRIEIRKKIKTKAGYVLRYSVWRKWQEYKYSINIHPSPNEKRVLRQFSALRSQLKMSVYMNTGFQIALLQNFEQVQSLIDRLSSNADNLIQAMAKKQNLTDQVVGYTKTITKNIHNRQQKFSNKIFTNRKNDKELQFQVQAIKVRNSKTIEVNNSLYSNNILKTQLAGLKQTRKQKLSFYQIKKLSDL